MIVEKERYQGQVQTKVLSELAQDASSPHLHRHRRRPVARQLQKHNVGECSTHLILGLLILVSLLVCRSLVFVRDALLFVQGLPSVTKNFSDLACGRVLRVCDFDQVWDRRTEADAWVFVADILALLVGKEHVRGQTTLGRVGICEAGVSGKLHA